MTLLLIGLEKKNKEAVVILNKYEHHGNQLLKESPRLDPKKAEAAVTRSHIREQQDLLAKANTAGSRFCAIGGETLSDNCDYFFCSKQRCHKRKLDDTEVNYLFSE